MPPDNPPHAQAPRLGKVPDQQLPRGALQFADQLVEGGGGIFRTALQKFAENVKEGMNIKIGDTEWPIISVGKDDDGYFAIANTTLEDGKYEATVTYRQTQVMGLLFNNYE